MVKLVFDRYPVRVDTVSSAFLWLSMYNSIDSLRYTLFPFPDEETEAKNYTTLAEARAHIVKIIQTNSLGEWTGSCGNAPAHTRAGFYTQVPQRSFLKSQVPAGAGGSWPVIGCHHLWFALHGGGGWEGQWRLINNTAVCSEGQESQEGEENSPCFLVGIK